MGILTIEGIDSLLGYLPYFKGEGNHFYEIMGSGKEGVHLMDPYNYSSEVVEFITLLSKVGFIGPEYNTEKAKSRISEYIKNPVLIASADLRTLREILTVGVCDDRFCSGMVACMIDDGTIKGCLQRLETIRSKLKVGIQADVDPDFNTRVIAMGTLPGDKSIDKREYFVDKNNDFWKLMGKALGVDIAGLSYDEKKKILFDLGIGLWDVYAAGERDGSSGKIKNGLINDFSELKTKTPHLKYVLLMGNEADAYKSSFQKMGYTTRPLPSSSGANRGYPAREEIWKSTFKEVLNL
jgi:hypoxanthine-DNA glycosylase